MAAMDNYGLWREASVVIVGYFISMKNREISSGDFRGFELIFWSAPQGKEASVQHPDSFPLQNKSPALSEASVDA